MPIHKLNILTKLLVLVSIFFQSFSFLAVNTGVAHAATVPVSFSSGTSHIMWPFPNSTFDNQGGWVPTGGSGAGAHFGGDYHAQDWAKTYQSGPTCEQDFFAPFDGSVLYINNTDSSPDPTYGNQVIIRSSANPNFALRISHLSSVNVNYSTQIIGGQTKLGEIGGSNGSIADYGCHAHIVLYKDLNKDHLGVPAIQRLQGGYGLGFTGSNDFAAFFELNGETTNTVTSPKVTQEEINDVLVQSTTNTNGYVVTRVFNTSTGEFGSWDTSSYISEIPPVLETVSYDDNGTPKEKLVQAIRSTQTSNGGSSYTVYTREYDTVNGWTSWSSRDTAKYSITLHGYNGKIYMKTVRSNNKVASLEYDPLGSTWTSPSVSTYNSAGDISLASTSTYMIEAYQDKDDVNGSGVPTIHARKIVTTGSGSVSSWESLNVSKFQPSLHAFDGKVYQLSAWNNDVVQYSVFNGSTWNTSTSQTKSGGGNLTALTPPQMSSSTNVLVQAVQSTENNSNGEYAVYARVLDLENGGTWGAWEQLIHTEVNVALQGYHIDDSVYLSIVNGYNTVYTKVYKDGDWGTHNPNGKGTSMVSMAVMGDRLYQAVAGPAKDANGSDQVLTRYYSQSNGGWGDVTTGVTTLEIPTFVSTTDRLFEATVNSDRTIKTRVYNKNTDTWTTDNSSSSITSKEEVSLAVINYTEGGQSKSDVVQSARNNSSNVIHTRVYYLDSSDSTWKWTSWASASSSISAKKAQQLVTFHDKVYQFWVKTNDIITFREYDPINNNPNTWTDRGEIGTKTFVQTPAVAANGSYLLIAGRSTENNATGTGKKVYWRKMHTSGSWTAGWSYDGAIDTINLMDMEPFQGHMYLSHVTPNSTARIRKFDGSSWTTVTTSTQTTSTPINIEGSSDVLIASYKSNNSTSTVYTSEYNCYTTCGSWSTWTGTNHHSDTYVALQEFDGKFYQAVALNDDNKVVRMRTYDKTTSGWSPSIYYGRSSTDIAMVVFDNKLYVSIRKAGTNTDGTKTIDTHSKSNTGVGWKDWGVIGYTSL